MNNTGKTLKAKAGARTHHYMAIDGTTAMDAYTFCRLLENSDPRLRGVLAYEDYSPGAAGTELVAKKFFARLSKGQTFLEAWGGANDGVAKWSAVIHEQAKGDTLLDWINIRPSKPRIPLAQIFNKMTLSLPDSDSGLASITHSGSVLTIQSAPAAGQQNTTFQALLEAAPFQYKDTYVWIRARLETAAGEVLNHDFTMTGLWI